MLGGDCPLPRSSGRRRDAILVLCTCREHHHHSMGPSLLRRKSNDVSREWAHSCSSGAHRPPSEETPWRRLLETDSPGWNTPHPTYCTCTAHGKLGRQQKQPGTVSWAGSRHRALQRLERSGPGEPWWAHGRAGSSSMKILRRWPSPRWRDWQSRPVSDPENPNQASKGVWGAGGAYLGTTIVVGK